MYLYIGGKKINHVGLNMEIDGAGIGYSIKSGCKHTGGSVKNQHEVIYDMLKAFHGRVEDDNKLHLDCLCDGTMVFMRQMVEILQYLGCTGIETESKIVSENEIPNGEPWCNCLFEASGILSKEFFVKMEEMQEN